MRAPLVVLAGLLLAAQDGAGNTICAAREPLRLERSATPRLGANEICEVDR